jgi:hypothetical protein
MPKVFISYSYDDEKHRNWVYDLASKLRANGVDVIFDQFETRIGSDLPLFMEQGLGASNRVICICSDLFNKKANSGLSGVGYEKRIICKDIIKDSSTAWVIPLIRKNSSDEKLPLFLSSLKYISFEKDDKFLENFYDLLRELHDQKKIPSLGKNPFEHRPDVIGKVEEIKQIVSTLSFTNKLKGTEKFNFLSNSGVFTIGTDLYEFKTNWSTAGRHSIHAYKDNVHSIAAASDVIERNKIDLEKYDFSSRVRTVNIGDSIIWVNRNGKILITQIENLEYENSQTHWIQINYEIIENTV